LINYENCQKYYATGQEPWKYNFRKDAAETENAEDEDYGLCNDELPSESWVILLLVFQLSLRHFPSQSPREAILPTAE
jgi:hypothetical protein